MVAAPVQQTTARARVARLHHGLGHDGGLRDLQPQAGEVTQRLIFLAQPVGGG